ncbi:MAG TPA: oxidoreductase [Ruminiclostridium sp.]|jgi:NAD(P)-dependent dehydrogenase (short-subunit alcohol dehydrogenase family)|nr:SDR family oxidoreductase [Clostridiaceae bacterium]HAA25659.1 oxidoreductase [Ruminiclostridium sp.]
MSITKKIILVTGASSGLGFAVARHLSDIGHTVYAGARSFGAERASTSPYLHEIYLDVNDPFSIESFVKTAIQNEGRIDVLINCAAVIVLGSVEDMSIEEYEKVINTNLFGTIGMCKAVIPYMREQRSGYIVNFSSIMGLLAVPFQSAYTSSKFAIEGFTEALSMEVKDYGIKAVLIEPTDHRSGSQKYRQHALRADSDSSPYRELFLTVTKKIEFDEAHGSDPDKLAKLTAKIIQKRNPRLRYKIGKFDQKLPVFLKRILPGRVFESIIFSYYNSGK